MRKIADTTVSGSAVASIDFQSISQDFAHLRAVIYARGTSSDNSVVLSVRMNNDSTAGHYYDSFLSANDASVLESGHVAATNTLAQCGFAVAGDANSGFFSATVVDFPHYTGGVGVKPFVGTSAGFWAGLTGNNAAQLCGGIWSVGGTAVDRLT